MDERGILEVDTPHLAHHAVPDPELSCFTVTGSRARYWLIPSPEYHLKRLLAAGYGDVYSLGPVFRDGEEGLLHEPEFTLLEYYRVGWDARALAEEAAGLVARLTGRPDRVRFIRFVDLFKEALGVDPLTVPGRQLWEAIEPERRPAGIEPDDRAALCDFWLGMMFYPRLGEGETVVVHGFPAEAAALARLDPADTRFAQRFEMVVGGIEIANGYHELADATEQELRFERDRERRRRTGQPDVTIDPEFMAALRSGLPDCSGIAIGFDRVVLLAAGKDDLASTLAFPLAGSDPEMGS
jgi:lysyl-tRNA synthetase class 2